MSTYNFEEQEKIDRLKAWWAAHGGTVLMVAAVFAASVAGSQLWNHYQKQQKQQAADLYAVLQQQLEKTGDANKIKDAALLLIEGFPASGYAPRAALVAAHASAQAGDRQGAKDMLQWILDHGDEPEIQDLARLRLAGIWLDERKPEQALALLNVRHGTSFTGLYADVRGDALAASRKISEARAAYQQALDHMSGQSAYQNVIQMKMDALRDDQQ
ncbi:YfgM family protein [Nitrosomonas sp. ANs5]|uniref:YfgM family protein n=1 Tax=Nitrosomonas sp. ANs5 TaxID=3423941 RepID=UPI00396DC9D9